ncbi:MAG: tRNA (5-methylaminomethyl-2-thiouridine)(34)-methyltransferase MnmD [Cytophagaceae bacterium]|nr:tRNA (5-methylaminomethyl-2-thiouridine)(34)-methyltransferase MnmD [Cytophagaceae bacterium]MDW8456692.1 tRNA (5-methylaminomethyl-2-thiouridine)(34)-methyltransferase MnmD [Cytophagaceae bacterium]
MNQDIEIIPTADGSHTLYLKSLDETYHSRHGAIRESQHIYINHGLHFFVSTSKATHVNILEIGFGTGLNALLSLFYAEINNVNIQYTAIEPYPLHFDIVQQLNYQDKSDNPQARKFYQQLHTTTWNRKNVLTHRFTLIKINQTLEDFESENSFDVIYFDAFAPSKQPDIWSEENIKKIYRYMNTRAVLTTYCAQGLFRRNLKEVGFKVHSLQGPPGKKEMTLAIKEFSSTS